jgi:Mg2+/Co2+ transporter CorB
MFAAFLSVVGLIILAMLVVSGILSAAETAFTRASRGRMHQLEREGDQGAKLVNQLNSDQETMIGALLVAYNFFNIAASVMAAKVIEESTKALPAWVGTFLATVVMTVLVIVFVEVLPKTLAIVRADDVARTLSGPIVVLVRVLGPIMYGIQWIVRHTLRIFGVQLDMETDVLAAHEEIRGAVEYHHSEGAVEGRDRRMLGGVLDLSEMDVSEIMVHRKSISMIDADLAPKELVTKALESPFTRLPVFREDPENIVGVLHAKDLARAMAEVEGDLGKLDMAAIIREPWFIPETTNLKDQLNAFLKRRTHFALVVDEYGALQGLVTLEDILEEIVGEIEDEHDTAIQGVRRQPDGSVVVDGEVTLRDLNRAFDWDLPDDHAVTVAGLVIHEAQTIPEPGQVFIFHRHRFQVLRRQRNQLTSLRVSPPLKVDASED